MYIFASDPHGSSLDWITKVETMIKKYPKATVVFGGDYIDRGHYSKELLTYVITKKNAIKLLGNHEEMLLKAKDDFFMNLSWIRNGGIETLNSFNCSDVNEFFENNPDIIKEMKKFKTEYVTDNFVFVHAGLDLDLKNPIEDSTKEDKLWIREPYFYNNNYKKPVFRKNNLDKVIVSGHSPTPYIEGYIGNTFIKGALSKYLKIQYPNEKPRYFADGGASFKNKNHIGIVLVFNEDGEVIDVI